MACWASGVLFTVPSASWMTLAPESTAKMTLWPNSLASAMKLSAARGGSRVELPLPDRTMAMEYDWHR